MAKPVWRQRGEHFLFHYSTSDSAMAIARSGLYVVSDRRHERHGSGMFLTTIKPGEMSRDDICNVLFIYQRDPSTLDGVVVVRWDDQLLATRPAGRRARVHPAAPRVEIDLVPVLVGYGLYTANDEWVFSSNCYI